MTYRLFTFSFKFFNKKTLFVMIGAGLLVLILHFAAFEAFERFLYKFEVWFPTQNIHYHATHNQDDYFPKESQSTEPMYVYDEYGFRTWNIDYNSKKGKRIIFVGSNSMGMGYGVPVSQSFPAYFWKKLSSLRPDIAIEVINLNLPGNPLPRNMAQLEKIFLEPLKPDVVIYGEYLYQTDLFFPSLPYESLTQKVFGGNHINFSDGQSLKNQPNAISQSYLEHSRFWGYLTKHSLLMAKQLSYVDTKMAELKGIFRKNKTKTPDQENNRAGYLHDLDKYLKDNNIPLLVVSLPNTKKNALHHAIYNSTGKLNVPYFPLEKKREIESYTFVENNHYSAKTNQQIGIDIAYWVDSIMDAELKVKSTYMR